MDKFIYENFEPIQKILCIGSSFIIKPMIEHLFQSPNKKKELWIYEPDLQRFIALRNEWIPIIKNTIYERNIHFLNTPLFYFDSDIDLFNECDCLFIKTLPQRIIPSKKIIIVENEKLFYFQENTCIDNFSIYFIN